MSSKANCHLEELVLSSLPFVTVTTRYQYCRIQPLSDIVDLSGRIIQDVLKPRIVKIIQRIAA